MSTINRLGQYCLAIVVVAGLVTPAWDKPAHAACAPSNHDPAVIKTVYRVGEERNVSSKIMLAGFEAGWIESHMNNLDCGDLNSLGVFQQRPPWWCDPASLCMDVVHASNRFFARAEEVDSSSLSACELAQKVQVSAHAERYCQAESKARELIEEAKRLQDPAQVVLRVGVSGVSFAGKFHEYFRRADNTVIHHLYTPGATGGWAADRDIAGAIASPPVATVHDGHMFVFARGTDNQLKYRFHSGEAWDAGWRTVAGGFSGTPAVTVRQERLFVFIRSGSEVMYRFHDAGVGWNSDGVWRTLGAPSNSVTAGSDPVTAFIGERMYVFVRGSDNRVWTRYHDASGWGPWGALAGAVVGQPTAVTNGDTLYVFARTASNEILYHYHAVGASAWTTARSLGGDVRGNPAAVSTGGTLLALARNPNGELVYRAHDGSAWTTWRELGRHSAALIDSSPVAFRHSDSAVFAVRGTDARLYSRQWSPSDGWNAWGALPGNHAAMP